MRKQTAYVCKCNCENPKEIIVASGDLKSGNTKSCGCNRHEGGYKTHGFSKTPIYRSWLSMKNRCNNFKNKDYHLYGGRGITYDPKWETFIGFYEDMGNTWFKKGTIDRIDTNGNYTKDNCRWITIQEQQLNKNTNIYNNINGEILTLSQIAERYNIHYMTIIERFKSGKRNEELIIPVAEKSEIQSDVKGVVWDKEISKWMVRIGINYKLINLGLFESLDDAIKVRLQAEIKHYGIDNAPQKQLFDKYNINECINFKIEKPIKGVTWHKKYNQWIARLGYNNKMINLGQFYNYEEALKTRLNAEKEYYGDLAPQKHLFKQYEII